MTAAVQSIAVLLTIMTMTSGDIAAQTNSPQRSPSEDAALQWAQDAIWYQVFVSRFCNGDSTNDRPDTFPWTPDWLGQPADAPPQRTDLYARRYGGDLQGLISKLPYLRDLGVNTLYLNPVFTAETEHKYDATDFRHVDDSFGVAGAMKELSGESADPSTWKWSASDVLFRRFLRDAHDMGFRVVIDGVFNHVGRNFWAFQDVRKKGEASQFAHWFDITSFDPLTWNAWDGPNGHLVKLARNNETLVPDVEKHIFDITKRWMDPDGDGDPSDGIDGWRLDAAEQVPHGFWQRWRKHVKAINPNALIVGEIWLPPDHWLAGDQFDVVTHYDFATAVTGYLRRDQSLIRTTQFSRQLDDLACRFDPLRSRSMVNLLGSHDTDRAVSMLMNPGRRFDSQNLPGAGDPPYESGKPGETDFARLRLAAVLQFTQVGAPMIYYGDEVGMYGADDPYCRAPMWWEDYGTEYATKIRQDLRAFYRGLCNFRKTNETLRRGDYRPVLADDARSLFAFERSYQTGRVVVVANASEKVQNVNLTIGNPSQAVNVLRLTSIKGAFPAQQNDSQQCDSNGQLRLELQPLSACCLTLESPENGRK